MEDDAGDDRRRPDSSPYWGPDSPVTKLWHRLHRMEAWRRRPGVDGRECPSLTSTPTRLTFGQIKAAPLHLVSYIKHDLEL